MFIIGLGTAAPPNRYTQRECWETVRPTELFQRLTPRSQAILKKVLLGDNGIVSRRLALDPLEQVFEINPDSLHSRFSIHAPALAAQAARSALAQAQIPPESIDALLISTCTGYLCPGLTSYVIELLGLKPGLLALDLVGQGCGAAVPNLRTADALLASGAARHTLSICVEVCSAAFYIDNDPGVLISACIFGDGAAAVVASNSPGPGRRRIEWKSASTLTDPADRDYLRFEQKNGLLRNILHPKVPRLAAKHAQTILTQTLRQSGVSRDQINAWILHPGGKEVLTALREQFKLTEPDTQWSAQILRDYGNMSSPCVLFVLEAALNGHAPDGLWWLSTFGAGFTCHGALLEVSGLPAIPAEPTNGSP